MPKTEFPPAIRSRPVYGVLEARPGKAHLLIADAEGAEAILDLAIAAPADFWAHAHIIYIPSSSGGRYTEKLQALKPAQFYAGPTYEAASQRIRDTFAKAHMGLQVCLSGTESLMGQAMYAATSAGIPHTAIQTEHRGSTARRMQCVHCKGITENVTTDPFECSHCGLNLFVRDHYSRRLAAFQAVCVDAEEPGNVPEKVELFR
jgi:dimethylamine monooxygenase subunit C